MRSFVWIAIPILVVAVGCGESPKVESLPPPPAAAKPLSKMILSAGPAGGVSIGDTLDAAKKAFPAPADAMVFNSAMNFAIVTKEGWAWASEAGKEGFEAASKDGKIIAMAITGGDA